MLARRLVLVTGLFLSLLAVAAENQYVLGVDGLACPFCAYGIEKHLSKVDGVTDIQVDISNSVVRVTLKKGQTFTEEQAREVVKEAGFTLRSFSRPEGKTGGQDAR